MRVFLYEYTSALPPAQTNSLHAEGWAMLQAVVEDFGKCPGVETLTLLHESIGQQLGHTSRRISTGQEEKAFRKLAAEADFTLVIAPEFDDILASRCRWVLKAGGRLLGSSPEVISLAADKFLLASRLNRAMLLYPPTILLPQPGDVANLPEIFFPAVCKPRFGAGTQATFRVGSPNGLDEVMDIARKEMPAADFILQRFVSGLPASVAFLAGRGRMLPLLPAAQHISDECQRIRYRGGEMPLPADLAERALSVASKAIWAIPDLFGCFGVDLVLGDAGDGSRDYVMEINPRLTTSYIGLRQLARANLAQALMDLVSGKDTDLKWRPGKVRFLADGTVLS
jgi:predicted ATP-grasp superfamily ATP-dependent carboligase